MSQLVLVSDVAECQNKWIRADLFNECFEWAWNTALYIYSISSEGFFHEGFISSCLHNNKK